MSLAITSPGHSCTRSAQLTPIFGDPIALPEKWNWTTEAELVNLRNGTAQPCKGEGRGHSRGELKLWGSQETNEQKKPI